MTEARTYANSGKIEAQMKWPGGALTPRTVAPSVRSTAMQPQSTHSPYPESICPECGERFVKVRANQRYCSQRCKWAHNNRTRTLKPNVSYDCVVCGKHVERYVSPSRQPEYALRYCSRTCARHDLRGDRHHAWNGGRTHNEQGYVFVHFPDHPHANTRGYVREHRLVMEQMIGRYLLPEEVVHHINGDVADNRPENLQLFASNAEHKAHESHQRDRDDAGRMLPLKGDES